MKHAKNVNKFVCTTHRHDGAVLMYLNINHVLKRNHLEQIARVATVDTCNKIKK